MSDSGDGSTDGPRIDPEDIDPAGATIAVAFSGAVVAFAGFALSVLVGDAALVFVVLGLAVVAASPVAYLRVRALRNG